MTPRTLLARTTRSLFLWLSLLACTFLAVTSAAQCGRGQEGSEEGVRSGMLVSTGWLAQHLQDDDLVLLCIASSPQFCDKGRIPGARFVSLGAIAITRDGVPNELPPVHDLQLIFESAGLSDNSHVVLYGERSGLFAARAYYTLDYMGLGDHASLLDGGLEKWKAEGRILADAPPKIQRGKLSVTQHPEILVSVSDMQSIAVNAPASAAVAIAAVAIIDARPPDEFSGVKISEDVPLAGHIPHAAGLYWMTLLESPANPVLRPEAELRQIFTQAGASTNKKVVTYCRSGVQSSYDYFVAKYLGYQTGMFDGSFYEWSHKGLPVEGPAKK
jgi:thiosulfate/3-mercaptopyruvate sulfurtransferase